MIADPLVKNKPPATTPTTVFPLENGDRLTRLEFERRYQASPSVKKAELIEGVVYMPSPVRHAGHGQPHAYLIGWLAIYCAATPGVELSDNATVRLDADNEPQPDALLRLDEKVGGSSRVSADDYIEGPPELIVEIAGSSASYDLHDKLNVYRRNQVQEYVVWRVYDGALNWFSLHEDKYQQIEPDKAGVICSRVFPGLHLAVEALLSGDLSAVLEEARRGVETEAHRTFVAQLQQQTNS